MSSRLRSTAVLPFKGLGFPRLGFQVGVNFHLVGVVVGEGMNLSHRQVTELPRDLLWNQTHVVPLRDPADRDSGAGDAGPSAADVGTLRDQAADFGDGCHRFNYNALITHSLGGVAAHELSSWLRESRRPPQARERIVELGQCLVRGGGAVFGDIAPHLYQVARRRALNCIISSNTVISIEHLPSISLLDAVPDLGPTFVHRGLARLLAFFKQTQAFADYFASGLIPAGGHASLDELVLFRCKRDIHTAADRHTQSMTHPAPCVDLCYRLPSRGGA